jgi:hypothetical protein
MTDEEEEPHIPSVTTKDEKFCTIIFHSQPVVSSELLMTDLCQADHN